MTIPRAHLVGGTAIVVALALAACGGTPAPSASGAAASAAPAVTAQPVTQDAPTAPQPPVLPRRLPPLRSVAKARARRAASKPRS